MSFEKQIYFCNHHHNQDLKHFYYPWKFFHAPFQPISTSTLALGNHQSSFAIIADLKYLGFLYKMYFKLFISQV